ncbi:Thiamin pyrophosphokinase [Gloeophyllum trabeum ATCC 11539]|uniref:Thiamine pyrophosphokinase n=1 Tax=Gloeophyllum trabeum (strain ATCC 11539 / FP-39264 / Madison 617) TaxID=670483 RepID=S7RGF4_GLOTA|nr:thiamine pyrophosphokinase [Gloeophyllum trabeum ATCC 11539]EPQ51624.1 Thiamin pyrophosphokinase [Gloeophyllum trabeum ATCC 11539]
MSHWHLPFLTPVSEKDTAHAQGKYALIILNQPFSSSLLSRVWAAASWRCCADGGANRLFDLLGYLPDLIKGDLDSIRSEVREYYESQGVSVVEDEDQYSTDLMKCISSIEALEQSSGSEEQHAIILLGGLSGRLDQTVHTLHLLHKLRTRRRQVFAVTDDNVGWVLDAGEHFIHINHVVLGQTCGLLPVGIDSTILSTKGLKWNLKSSFDGLVSTSNHLVPEEDVVWVRTSRPIWWVAELRKLG